MPQSARDTAAAITASGLVLIMATAMAVLWVQGRPVPPDLYMTMGAGLGFLGLAVAPKFGIRAAGLTDTTGSSPGSPGNGPGNGPGSSPGGDGSPGAPAAPSREEHRACAAPTSPPASRRSRTRPRAGEGPR
jgi:uncharacterized membrane protein YgcG